MTNMVKRANGTSQVPFGSLVDNVFQNSMSRIFDDSLWGAESSGGHSKVPVNIRERDRHYELEVVAPGLKREELQVQINDNLLTVSFEQRAQNVEQSKDTWLRREFRMQSFTRSFSLDETIDANNIGATYQDGLLCIHLPKKEGAQKISKAIEVK
jgi:HSP20 family protein